MRVVIFFLFIVALSLGVKAIAVSSDYLEDDTLLLVDGASTLYGIRLQNSGSEKIYLKLVYDDSIAKAIDYEEVYTVPPQSSKPVSFNITAPKWSNPGDVFSIGYTVHELAGRGDGSSGIPVLLKISKSFNVKIIKDPNKFYIDELKQFMPQAIVILIIIFAILIKKYGMKNTVKNSKSTVKKKK